MPTQCLIKEPFNSRTYKSSNVFFRKQDRHILYESKRSAWDKHRGTWGTAIYEHPIKGVTHKDLCDQRNLINSSKLPPCSLKGHRHFGAAAEPITLLEGNVDTAEKGASSEFRQIFEEEVMGNPLYGAGTEKIKNSTATKQKDFNHNWKEYGALMQLNTKACLEYATRLQVSTSIKSTMGNDYVQHETAAIYQPLPAGGLNSDNIKTPFAQDTKKQQEKYNALIKKYYKELYSKSPIPKDSQTKPSLKPRVKTARTRCRTTTPPPVTTPAVPTKRAKSAMLRAVSEATSTSEVTCSLAILPGSINEKSKTREDKLTAKVSDAIANRNINLKRADLTIKPNVAPVQYFLSETRATQTENGVVDGLNPRWPPSNKSENPEKIGYPHLRLPLAINTLGLDTSLNEQDREPNTFGKQASLERNTSSGTSCPPTSPRRKHPTRTEDKLPTIRAESHAVQSGCVKSQAHAHYNKEHESDWVPRIWDYNYLLFHLNRRGHCPNNETVMSCHASLHVDGLIS